MQVKYKAYGNISIDSGSFHRFHPIRLTRDSNITYCTHLSK